MSTNTNSTCLFMFIKCDLFAYPFYQGLVEGKCIGAMRL